VSNTTFVVAAAVCFTVLLLAAAATSTFVRLRKRAKGEASRAGPHDVAKLACTREPDSVEPLDFAQSADVVELDVFSETNSDAGDERDDISVAPESLGLTV
jgi:serine protease inhibitor